MLVKILAKLDKKIVFLVFFSVLILGGVIASFFLYKNYFPNKPQKSQQISNEDLLNRVGKLISLPQDENPTIAVVSDKSKLVGESFFKNAQNGDSVLIYLKAKKAILYRSSTNKLIEVAFYNPPIDNQASASAKPSEEARAKIKVYILNGTKIAGLAKTTKTSLDSKFSSIEIIGTGNASGEFSKTLVVDVSGENSDLVSSLAKELKGSVGKMPNGEERLDQAEILIFLGSSN